MSTRKASYNYKRMYQPKKNKKTKSTIPTFGYKSAGVIVLTLILINFFLPNILAMIGLDFKLVALLANAIFLSLAVCYCQFFIETNKGITSTCIKVYVGLCIATGLISYFWLYIGLYI